MPKYKIVLTREVVEIDQVIREIEAPSRADAYGDATIMASQFNEDCPDDAAAITTAECRGWKVEEILDAPL
jgi:hypothetical protein